MKILCISNYYPPFFEGGYEISMKETMDYLQNHGYDIYILCGNKGIDRDTQEITNIKPGIPLRALHYIDYINGSFWNKSVVEKHNYKITKSIIKQTTPDLVYIGNMKAVSIAPVIAIQQLKIAHIFDLGDIWLKTYIQKGIISNVFRLIKRIIPFMVGGNIRLDPVIVLTQWMKATIQEMYGSKEIYVIPRGIEVKETGFRQTIKPLKFIFAGRIEPMKGLDLCIKAFHNIINNDPKFEFTFDIFGEEDHNYASSCRKLVNEYELEQHIHFMGKSYQLMDLYHEYDIMLMPTLAQEAFGRVIIEAMSQRLIVIATDAYGPKEIITNGVDGFLFERGSVDAMAQRIADVTALSINELDEIKQQALNTISNKYEISLVKKQIEVLISAIVNKSRINQL